MVFLTFFKTMYYSDGFRNHLVECGLADECVRVARMASLEEIRSVHSETHTLSYGTDMLTSSASTAGATKLGGKLSLLSCGGLGVDSDTYWNERFTGVAARTAVGSVVELSTKVRLIIILFYPEGSGFPFFFSSL